MIDYQNITDNEIKRIVVGAANPGRQVRILSEITGKSVRYIEIAAGMKTGNVKTSAGGRVRKYGVDESEVRYIKDNADMPAEVLAQELGRSVTTVRKIRQKLGINADKRESWDEATLDELIEMWILRKPVKEISLLTKRSLASVYGKLAYLKEKGVITDAGGKRRKVQRK